MKWGSEITALISGRVRIQTEWRFRSPESPFVTPSLCESFREGIAPHSHSQTRGTRCDSLHPDTSSLQWIICLFLLSSQAARHPHQNPTIRAATTAAWGLTGRRRALRSRLREMQAIVGLALAKHALVFPTGQWDWLCALDAREAKVSDPGPSTSPQDSQLSVSQNPPASRMPRAAQQNANSFLGLVWAWESAFYLLRWYLCVIKFGTHCSRPVPLSKPDNFPVLVSWLNHFSSVSLSVPGERACPGKQKRERKKGQGRWLHSASTGWTPIFRAWL